MLYAIYCLDRPGQAGLRAATRQAHLDFLAPYVERIRFAGPLLAEDGESMVGSLLVIDFPDRAAVDAFLAADPYAKAGLFQSAVARPWRQVLPKA